MYVVNDSHFGVEEHRDMWMGRVMSGGVNPPCSVPLTL